MFRILFWKVLHIFQNFVSQMPVSQTLEQFCKIHQTIFFRVETGEIQIALKLKILLLLLIH